MKMKLSNDLKLTLTSSLAVGAIAGSAGADVFTVMDPSLTVLSTNQWAVSVFSSTLNLTSIGFYGYTLEPNTISMAFSSGYYGTFGIIQSNAVIPGATPPVDSPALMTNNGAALDNLGSTVDIARSFNVPFSVPYYGTDQWITATLRTAPNNDFNMFAYADGDFGYIGYTDSAFGNFGYMQVQRDNLTTWHLIGYRFGTMGESILIEDLSVPAPSALAVLAVGGLFAGGRKRRAS